MMQGHTRHGQKHTKKLEKVKICKGGIFFFSVSEQNEASTLNLDSALFPTHPESLSPGSEEK